MGLAIGRVASLCPLLPLKTFQPVLDQEHIERNGDGTIGISTNDLAEGPHSRTRRTINKIGTRPALGTPCMFLRSTLRVLAHDNY